MDGDDAEYRWLVDPIDGTTNFVNGMHYTISIALRRGSKTVAGALYNPVADEMFTAIRGQGAFLNGERLQVSPQAEVGLMAIGTGLPIRTLHSFEGYYSRLERIRDPIGAIRIVGSSANSCAHVACGRLTGYFEEFGAGGLGGGGAARRGSRRGGDGLVGPWAGGLRADGHGDRRERADARLSAADARGCATEGPVIHTPAE